MEYDEDEAGLSGWTEAIDLDPEAKIITCLAGWAYDSVFGAVEETVEMFAKMTYGEHPAGDFEIVRNALAEMTHYGHLDYDDDGVPEQLRVLSRTAIRLVGDFDAVIKRVAARMIEGYDPVRNGLFDNVSCSA